VGKRRSPALRFYFEYAGKIAGAMPSIFMVPAVIARRWHLSLRKRGFGTSRWLMRAKTIPVSGTRKRGAHVRYWPKAGIPICTAFVRFWGKADMAYSVANVRF
jgi:hypothetical protein